MVQLWNVFAPIGLSEARLERPT